MMRPRRGIALHVMILSSAAAGFGGAAQVMASKQTARQLLASPILAWVSPPSFFASSTTSLVHVACWQNA